MLNPQELAKALSRLDHLPPDADRAIAERALLLADVLLWADRVRETFPSIIPNRPALSRALREAETMGMVAPISAAADHWIAQMEREAV